MKNDWQLNTNLIHASADENPSTAVSSPIYQSSTYQFDSPEGITEAILTDAHPQFYGRYANPNSKQAEATIAKLAGAEAALTTASGMAAISLVLLSLLKAGDHIVAQKTLYPTTSKLLTHKLPELGISTTFVDQTNNEAFEQAIQPNTKLIYVETPVNPTLSITDLHFVAQLGREHNLTTVADNTFASSFNQRPLSLGIDLVLHSATKYLGGHSDLLAGVIAGSAEKIAQLWNNHMLLGAVLHPMEAWLLERGLKTYGVRMPAHNSNALAVARYLEEHTAVHQLYYPGLPSHPQHSLAKKQMPGGFGGMVCFDLRGGRQAGYDFLQKLQMIPLAVSLGGVHSLITHPASTVSAVQSEGEIVASGVQPGLVRFSVGLEDVGDIIADLEQALLGL